METPIREHIKRRTTAQRSRAEYSIEPLEEKGTFRVAKADGTAYLVNLDAGTCTCPDYLRRLSRRQEYSGVWCKHIHLCAASFMR